MRLTVGPIVVSLLVAIAGCSRSHGTPGGSLPPVHNPGDARSNAKATGLIFSAAEMQKPVPSPDRNAAPLYVKLATITKRATGKPGGADNNLPWFGASTYVERSDIPALSAYLRQHKAELELMREAAKRRECAFKRDWYREDPTNITFPDLAAMRHGTRLLLAESQLLALRGRYAEAVGSLVGCLRAARHAGSERIVLATLVQIALDAIALSGLRKVLYCAQGDPKVAALVREAIEHEYTPPSCSEAIRGEAFVGWQTMETARRIGPAGLSQLADEKRDPKRSLKSYAMSDAEGRLWFTQIDQNETVYLDRTSRAAVALRAPYVQSRELLSSIQRESSGHEKDPSEYLADVLLPDYRTFAEKCATAEALASVTRASALVLEWRAAHGRFPESPDEMRKPWPVDPFDMKPLKYWREGDGFVVYSVGPSGHYDGGSSTVKPQTSDAVFRFPRPDYFRPARERVTVGADAPR